MGDMDNRSEKDGRVTGVTVTGVTRRVEGDMGSFPAM